MYIDSLNQIFDTTSFIDITNTILQYSEIFVSDVKFFSPEPYLEELMCMKWSSCMRTNIGINLDKRKR